MLERCFQNIFIYGNIISICMLPLIIYLAKSKTKYKITHIYKIFLIIVFALQLPLLNIHLNKENKENVNNGQQINVEMTNYEQNENMKTLLIENNNLLNRNIEIKSNSLYINIKYLPYIWITVALIGIIYNLIAYVIFIKRLKVRYIVDIQKFMNSKEYSLKIKKNIHIGVSEKVNNPISIGIFKKSIIFPNEEIKNKDFKFMLEHEIFHIQNKDIECKFLLLILNAIYWFNPIVYFISKQMNEIIEMNVDYNILKKDNFIFNMEYGNTLLKQIEKNRIKKYQIITNFADSKKSIINRFYNITNNKKKEKGIIIVNFLVVVSIIAITLILLFPNIVFAVASNNTEIASNNNKNNEYVLPNSNKYIKPIIKDYYISSNYNEIHKSIDIGIAKETNSDVEIVAIHSGVVLDIGYDNDLGNYIVIKDENGMTSLYACCSKLNVIKGENVSQGDIIGFVGKTGKSTGLHLHLEMSINGEMVNPQELIQF